MKNMKKSVILALIALFFGNIAFSQTDEFVMTWAIVESEAKKSDDDIANAKKAAKINTWLERGRRYLQVYTFDKADNIYYGYSYVDIMSVMGGAKAKATKSIGDTTVQSFDRVDFYFVKDKLVKYERTERAKEMFFQTHTGALDVATEAYLKASELNTDGKKTKVIADQLKTLANLYQKEALFYYYSNKNDMAAPFYTKAGNIVKTGLTGEADTVRAAVLKNCGTINQLAKNYDQAISFYNDINSISASIDIYASIYYCQLMKQDTASAINTLQNIMTTFPKDSSISTYLNQLIDIYIKSNQVDKATEYLQKAIEAEPSNTAYLFNLGYLSETKNDNAAAIDYYKKVIAINANEPNANFNLGRLYAEQGNAAMKAAEALWGKKGYQPKKDEGTGLLKQSCACFEISAQNTSDNNLKKNAYYNLMKLYAQLGDMKKSNEAKAKYNEI